MMIKTGFLGLPICFCLPKKKLIRRMLKKWVLILFPPKKFTKSIKNIVGKDRPTDVISFAIEDGLDEDFMAAFNDDPDFVEDIGDLFLCPEVIKRHSVEYETGFNREFGYTLVHGYLHLNGFDHIEDDEAKVMFGIQGKVLREYGLPLHPDQENHGKQIH